MIIIFSILLCTNSIYANNQNGERKYKIKINQYNENVVNSYPQQILKIKKKKNYDVLFLKVIDTKKRQNYFELTRCNNEYYNKYLVETDYIDYQAVEIKKLSEKLGLMD